MVNRKGDVLHTFSGNRPFSELISKHYPALHAYAMGILLDRHSAEDVCQEVFLKAHQMGTDFDCLKNRKAYLYTMVRNCCMDRYRLASRQQEVPLTEQATLSAAYSPETDCLRGELDGVIMAGMQTLKLEAREILLLRDVQGLRYKQIAELAGVPVSRVRWKLREARQKMKAYVEANYGG